MYLKRLEIVGFKSFTERVVVPFSPGVSSVVGPNGCGKSNIIDAIRWVMGEQSPRHLRARAMEDILFNGSRGRAPAALAEVTIVLTRELDGGQGLAEVGVTRRLYRGGDSEYLINKSPSRLKDILRFFMEAGMGTRAYNIIEQEKVGRLVDARPEDRRLLLDEAAGIVRFKEQKKESERKIESAERNLTAVEALLAETKKSLNEVSRAAAKANRYQALREELRELELIISAKRFLELKSRRGSMTDLTAQRQAELTDLSAEVSATELAAETLRLEETALERSLEDELTAYHDLQNSLKTHQLEKEHARETLAGAEGRREKASSELAELDTDFERRQNERAELTDSISLLQEENRLAGEKRDALRERWLVKKSAHDTLARERDEAAASLANTKESLQILRESLAGSESLVEHLKERQKHLGLEKNQGDLAMKEAKEKLASRERFKELLQEESRLKDEEIAEKREDLEFAREELESGSRKLSQIESQVAALSARLSTLEDLKSGFSWYPAGVKALMTEPSLRNVLLGPVAEYIEPPEGFEKAVEVALGERLAWLVAKDKPGALEALRFARDKGLGRSGFVAKAELGRQELLEALLGQCQLFEDLGEVNADFALTRSGEYLAKAFLVGGQGEGAEDQGLLARLKEMEEAETQLDSLKGTLNSERSKVELARENRSRAESALAAAQSERENLVADLAEANSNIMLAKADEKALLIRLDSLEAEVAQILERLAETESKREKALGERDSLALELEGLEQNFLVAQKDLTEREEELNELQEQGVLSVQEAESVFSRLTAAEKALKGAEEWLDNLDSRRLDLFNDVETLGLEIESLKTKLETLDTEFLGLPDRLSESEARVSELRKVRESSRFEAQKMDEKTRDIRKKRDEAAKALGLLEKDDREIEYGLSLLAENLLKDWRVILVDPVEEAARIAEEARLAEEARIAEAEKAEAAKLAAELAAQENLSLAGPDQEPLEDLGGFYHKALAPVDPSLVGLEPETENQENSEDPENPEDLRSMAPNDNLASTLAEVLGAEPENPDDPASDAEEVLASDADEVVEENEESDAEENDAENAEPENGALASQEPVSSDSQNPESPGAADGSWSEQKAQPPEVVDAIAWADHDLPSDAFETRQKLKERLASMGEINWTAIEKETELTERYNFHKGHYDDLTRAIGDLKNGINRINQTCRELFAKTFKEADAKFREIFPVLFEGGEGWLGLSDENDPLESGVEIHVHPPGKKIMVMSLLSGGEKALTALALIFALYLIKPSPFCLLDEADAPLDEANIDRFNRLLRRLSEASQIIMVTHNKRTMQISDTLYGVTMETPGVSRLVSVNLAQAEVMTNV
ncbi:MAG: AAA family ATPase [Deltaproteobacteria bacterium]|jgi:chromosome segregation protein|nr:AAA family ATPase [Deltaproteobacteria bacterium]